MFKTEQLKDSSQLLQSLHRPSPLAILLFMIIFFSHRGLATQGDKYPSTPEGVVEKFCQLDAEGWRLSSKTYESMLPLVTWPEEITAGETMRVIHLISGFKLGNPTIQDSIAKVTVEYQYLGSTDTLEFSEAKRKRRTIIFELIRQNDKWKIQKPLTAPHVSWGAGIVYLRSLQKNKSYRKEQLEVIIQKIMKAKERLK